MAISEEARHQLYEHLREMLGGDDAATLMAHLPPVGWADVATKHDLDIRFAALQQHTDDRFAMVELHFQAMDRRFGEIDRRFGEIDRRFGEIDGRIEGTTSGLEHLTQGMDRLRSELHTTMIAFMSMTVVLIGSVIALLKL